MRVAACIAVLIFCIVSCKPSKQSPKTETIASERVLAPLPDSLRFFLDSLAKHIAETHQCRITMKLAGDSVAAWYTGYDGRLKKSITDFSGTVDIGSCTKMFTATAILQLVEQKKLSLQDKLTAVLPNDTLYRNLAVINGKDYIDSVKVVDLLHHSSGLPDYFIEGDDEKEILLHGDSSLSFTPYQLMALAKATNKPTFVPGTAFKYSNTNYILLGLIIEKLSGKNWAEYVQQYILNPLELKQTYFAGQHSPAGRTPGYFKGKVSVMPASLAWSAGEIISTLDDMQRFIHQWNKGKLFSNPTLTDTLRHEYLLTMEGPVKYGLGVIKLFGLSYGHAGQTFGFQSYMAALPNGYSFSLAIDDAAVSAWEPAMAISGQLARLK